MKLGMYVPLYINSPKPALEIAAAAEGSVDGLFVFDHLFAPPNLLESPHRQSGTQHSLAALPMLALLAGQTELTLGTLVIRVGVIPDELLYSQLMTLHAMTNGNFIAGLGVGDKFSTHENEAMKITVASRPERLDRMGALALRLQEQGVEVWFGGRSQAVRDLAEQTQAVVNQWQCDPSDLRPTDTWGGVLADKSEPDLKALASAGASWSVCLVPDASRDPQSAVDRLLKASAG